MNNSTIQYALYRMYLCAGELNTRPISARTASMQVLLNLAEKLQDDAITEERLAEALIEAAQNLLK